MRVGTPQFIGERLKEVREARGLTCLELSNRLCITRSSVSNYENNLQTPSPTVLHRLCVELEVSPQYFMKKAPAKEPATLFFRSFNSATKRARIAVARRYEWLREVAAFIHQYVKFPAVNVPNALEGDDYRTLTTTDVEEIAVSVRRHWSLGDRPISNVIWLLENQGVVCSRFRFEATTLDAFSEWRHVRPFVILSSDKNCCARSRYDAAHELAHMVLHRDVSKEELTANSRFSVIEEQANAFAGAFLMPEATFRQDFVPKLDVLRDLKAKWHVSIAAMIVRGKAMQAMSDAEESSLWRQLSRRGWRKREPLDDILPPEQPEFLRRSIRMLEEKAISSTRDISFHLGLTEGEIRDLCGCNSGERIRTNAQEPDRAAEDASDKGAIVIPFTPRR